MYIKEILEEFELEYCFDEMLPVDINSFEDFDVLFHTKHYLIRRRE